MNAFSYSFKHQRAVGLPRKEVNKRIKRRLEKQKPAEKKDNDFWCDGVLLQQLYPFQIKMKRADEIDDADGVADNLDDNSSSEVTDRFRYVIGVSECANPLNHQPVTYDDDNGWNIEHWNVVEQNKAER